ncbi:hypothetical protein SEPCBS57363_006387 [Sporothrix epigloea]|uniref:Uncharacterized protein n=1 Tax=Sporothrix epigloea TaxID=1892477 RepID=A0ABP0E701_9PEZI
MADDIAKNFDSKKNLVPGSARPPGPVAPPSRAPPISQPESGLNTAARVAFIARIVEFITKYETHDSLRVALYDEFENWDANDFKGIGMIYARLKEAMMTHGVHVPDHHRMGGSMRKSIIEAITGVKWTKERATALKGYETIVTRDSDLQEYLEKK